MNQTAIFIKLVRKTTSLQGVDIRTDGATAGAFTRTGSESFMAINMSDYPPGVYGIILITEAGLYALNQPL